MIKLEEGKFYRDVNGSKHGPMTHYGSSDDYEWSYEGVSLMWWNGDGKSEPGMDSFDLVAEWGAVNSPVRTETITRTAIEPGVYGRLVLCKGADGKIRATLKNDGSTDGMWELLSALEWRELARIATELADGLDAQ